ncbi:MAG: hypothetical protein ACLR0U_03790 [Enterocloster clostridioformis]
MDSLQPHIRCSRQDGAAYAILPGDPARVERIKGFLEDVKEIAFNRSIKASAVSIRGFGSWPFPREWAGRPRESRWRNCIT